MSNKSLYTSFAPFIFVLIWATGFIAAGYAGPYAEPLSFLFTRYVLAGLALAILAAFLNTSWPRDLRFILHCMISGVLLHGLYLGCVWWAVRHGVPAGISGIIAALQPILTALFAPVLVGEVLSKRQWGGILLGFCGLVLVISRKIAAVDVSQMAQIVWPIAVNMLAMLAITLGTFYQKRFLVGGDVKAVTVWQYVGAALITLPAALMLESFSITWNTTVVLTMAWSVFGLSIGGILLLLGLIARGEVSRAATYIFLVPPTAALMALVLFGETLSALQVVGMLVSATGVWLATRK